MNKPVSSGSAAVTTPFALRFTRYLDEAHDARQQDAHHDQRRALFLSFLYDAFGIDASDVDIEQYIQLQGQKIPLKGTARVRKGWIDAVFHDLIFEFKRDFKKEEADGLRELHDYLSNIPDGNACVGLLTDGFKFVAYVLDENAVTGLRQIDALDLEKCADMPALAYQWLDAYLLSQRSLPPTSADIVKRFGLSSPTFAAAGRILREALATFSSSQVGASEVKRQQWAFYLARVYGSADARNNEMFVRHTYLCQFAKLLAYTARFGIEAATQHIEDVISGAAFEVLGVSNIGEQDFFAWVLAPEVQLQMMQVFCQIVASLVVYDLSRIDEDLLKQLYQNLVEPETRHELGEFYTPDWLAELTLREIGYGPGKSLLDPACGSGTFLFTALRLLREQGLSGDALVNFALENIMGVDVHPLAVTIARINYMLAILPHLQATGKRGRRPIPIAMANSLQVPNKARQIAVIAVPIDTREAFEIPTAAAQKPKELAEVLDAMQGYAERAASTTQVAKEPFMAFLQERLPPPDDWGIAADTKATWGKNADLLAKQIRERRDTIWVYLLKNTSQPLILQQRKFDVVAGNPPWIAYRYLQDESYRSEVKKLTRDFGLLGSEDTKLNTQIELSTIFYEYSYNAYLKAGGTIAFVMPRSVLTGAKQHRAFQQKGFSRIVDLQDVAPLFNVPTCVLIRSADTTHSAAIPTEHMLGRLLAQECRWEQAQTTLTRTTGETNFGPEQEIASPYYHPRFKQGATLVPRNLVFVTSAQPHLPQGQIAHSSIMRSDRDVDAEAKAPWKGISLQGHIDDDFLYASLLSKNLLPFGVRKLHLVALPAQVGFPEHPKGFAEAPHKQFLPRSLDEMRDSITFARSANDWFAPAERLWVQNRKSKDMMLWDRFDYQQGVIAQNPEPGYLVVYNADGSNIASTVIDTHTLPILNGAQPQAIVIEHVMYWYHTTQVDEAHYLSALLNAPCVDAAIKKYQPRGLFGARHIQRRPFEVCPIPAFDGQHSDHQQLAALSREAHAIVAKLDINAGAGVVAARKQARMATYALIQQIDAIAQRLLGLAPASSAASASDDADQDIDEETDTE